LILPNILDPEASKLLLVNALETIVIESIGETPSSRIVIEPPLPKRKGILGL
jgi:hypothetical protein